MKQHPFPYILLGALLTTLCVSVVGGNEPASMPHSVAGELSGIRVALEDLGGHLQNIRRSSDAALVVRQIELHEQRVAPLESRLARNKREFLDTQSYLAHAIERLAQAEKRIEDIKREGQIVPEEMQKERDLTAQACERDKVHVETLKEQMVGLENQIAEARDSIAILEERLARLLDTD